MSNPDPHFRPYSIAPGWPVELVVHGRDGSTLRIRGVVDRVPSVAGELAREVVIVDAVAEAVTGD